MPNLHEKKTDLLPKSHIQGLDELFRDHAGCDGKNFPVGSTIVLSGPPGAGKTTMALALVRSMMCSRAEPVKVKDPADPAKRIWKASPRHITYYVSTEVNRDRLKKMYLSRGWFGEKDGLFSPDPEPDKTSGLHVINPPLEIERPVKTSEELVNYIVRQIAVESPPQKGQKVFIIVDSVTALFKDCRTPGQGRRQTHELTHRLQQQFSQTPEEAETRSGTPDPATTPAPTSAGAPESSLGLIILLAEQGIENMGSPGMETYVADFVFNLGFKSLTMGTRLRTVEITKSQGANLMMGTHTWLIVTNDSLERVIAGESLCEAIKEKVAIAEGLQDLPEKWGTVIFLHRPYFLSLEDKKKSKKEPENVGTAAEVSRQDLEFSGIRGLDQMLKFDADYWFSDPLAEQELQGAIEPGSVTMLVGEAGTGKTSLCYHFIARHLLDKPAGVALLIGFEKDFKPLFKDYGGRYKIGAETVPVDRCRTIYRPRSGLHFNLLLMEIREWLKQHPQKEKRIAIDGLSNLASIHSRQEFSQMLDAIISLVDQRPQRHSDDEENSGDAADAGAPECGNKAGEATGDKGGGRTDQPPPIKASLLLTYESAQAGSIFGSEVFRLPADNIIILEHKDIEDDRRTAVTVIKSSHQRYDTMVRELELNHSLPATTHIKSGFDAYSGLLSGKLRRATVVLQLFEENQLEGRFNKALQKQLQELLPYHISLRNFSRFDISSTLNSAGTHIRVPHGDVLISNMDEWWLSHKVALIDRAVRVREEPSRKAWQEAVKELEDAETAHAEAADLNALKEKIKRAKKKVEEEGKSAACAAAREHQLVSLAGFVQADEKAAIKPGDFWCFEMEKCRRKPKPVPVTGQPEDPAESGLPARTVGPYALPSFLDFGMLCIHRKVVEGQKNPDGTSVLSVPDIQLNLMDWYTTETVPWPVRSDRTWFTNLLDAYLLPWCAFKEDWFAEPDVALQRTLVDIMAREKSRLSEGGTVSYGFAWDSRTPETAACVLYELAWAFGGSSDLFCQSPPEKGLRNQDAVKRALSFLGFLVVQDLMPVCPTLTDTSQAVFSRHYYSTFMDVNLRHWRTEQRQGAGTTTPAESAFSTGVPPLISLGFMPPGPLPDPEQASSRVQEEDRERFDRLLTRAVAVSPVFAESLEEPQAAMEKRKEQLKRRSGESAQDLSRTEAYYESPNPADLEELTRWMDFRDGLSSASSWSEALGDKQPSSLTSLRTGHGCCGAWMVGVKGPAASPGLAQVVLQEITSLNFAKKRARMGAGMPARQDFYRYYGDRPVTGMEQFSWNELLCFLGSRAHRRDRVYPEPASGTEEHIDPARMHKFIQHQMNMIMTFARSVAKTEASVKIPEHAGMLAKELFERAAPERSKPSDTP